MKKLVSAAVLSAGIFAFGSVTAAILPSGSDDSATIQSAIDAASADEGTVTLGEGLFQLQSQLMVTGGVTVVGQGYDKTVLKFAGTANTSSSRVATVSGGSALSRVAVTGASVKAQNGSGAVSISDGTISYCCVTNNTNIQGTGGGITANGKGHVKILRTIVANNAAATGFEGVGGGIGIRGDTGLRTDIDACLVYGNTTGGSKDRHGAGIGISYKNTVTTTIRNTTIANNVLTGSESLGSGLYVAQADTTLINCILSGNTAQTTTSYFGDANAAFSTGGIETKVASQSANNIFDSAGNVGFVSANDYHLTATSAAIHQGVACADLTTDLDGNAYAATPSAGCYEFTGANPNPTKLPPTLGSVNVVPFEKTVAIYGILTGLGTDATSCDISLALNGAAAKTVVTGATKTFDYEVFGLAANTTYTYTLTVANNATTPQAQTLTGSFTTLSAGSAAVLSDYTNYRTYSGRPQSVLLSYYDGPDTRGFSWQTADCVTSGKVWIRKGDYLSADDIIGKSDTTVIDATSVVHAGKCTTYKAHTGSLSVGLWSYCLGTEGKTSCGQFTIRAAEGGFTAVNYNDIQTKIASKLFRWGNVATATCNVLPSGFDCILSGGDFTDGSSDVGADDYIQWGVIADTGRSKLGDAPWVMACGNHESEACSRGYDIFKELASEKFDYTPDAKHIGCHAFQQGGVLVATLPYYDNSSAVPTAVTNWLARTVAAAKDATWRIVVVHAGPYTTGDHGAYPAFRTQMTPLFAKCKIDLVLQAHDHTYSRTVPYRWSGAGYSTTWEDSDTVLVRPATTNVQEVAGTPFYLNPEGTVYVSAGCSGHRLGENANYASGKDVFSFSNSTYKTQIDTVKISSKYATAGSLGSKDLTMPMFAVLKVNGGLLTYDWYVGEEDGSATLFDSLRICKNGEAGGASEPGTDPVDPGTDPVNPGTDPVDPDPGTDPVEPGSDPVLPGADAVNGTVRWNGYDIVYTGLVETVSNVAGTTDTVLVFTNGVASFTLPVAATADILVVGGGAGGVMGKSSSNNKYNGNGGNGGSVIATNGLELAAGTYAVNVGAGGIGYSAMKMDFTADNPGAASSFAGSGLATISAAGGTAWKTQDDKESGTKSSAGAVAQDGASAANGTSDITGTSVMYGLGGKAPLAENVAVKVDGIAAVGFGGGGGGSANGGASTPGNGGVVIVRIKGGEGTDPGTDPVDPGTNPVDPGTDPVDPGTDPVNPGTDPVVPGGQTGVAKKVTFTVGYNGAETLSNIPVLVKLSANNPVGFSYADCAANGSDIRFADANGAAIPFEIDTWDMAGESLIWVKAPAVTNGTQFTMCYKGASNAANVASDVWSDYTGVWHLNALGSDTTDNSQGLYLNSTATTGIDGHLSEKSIADEAGRFGKAFKVNDSTGWKQGNYNEGGVWVNDAGENSALDANGVFTISGWFKHADWNYYYGHLFYKRQSSNNTGTPNGSFASELGSNTNDNRIDVYGSSDSKVKATTSFTLMNTWVYLSFVYEGTQCSVYANGELVTSGTVAAVTDNNAPLVFGNNVNIASGLTGDAAWAGLIDEVRYLKGAKSAEWIAAEYAAMASDTFVTAGAVEDIASEAPSAEETSTTPVAVPYAWLAENGLVSEAASEADYESAASASAANGRSVWECYVALLDPKDADAQFETSIAISNGMPVVTWTPYNPSLRAYTVEGKVNLTDSEWAPTNQVPNARFFRVNVGLK